MLFSFFLYILLLNIFQVFFAFDNIFLININILKKSIEKNKFFLYNKDK